MNRQRIYAELRERYPELTDIRIARSRSGDRIVAHDTDGGLRTFMQTADGRIEEVELKPQGAADD